MALSSFAIGFRSSSYSSSVSLLGPLIHAPRDVTLWHGARPIGTAARKSCAGNIAANCRFRLASASDAAWRSNLPMIRTPIAALLLSASVLGATAAVAAPVDPALYSSLHWRLLGPFRAGWAEMIEGIPSKPNTYYFGASGGGVWKTDDAGRTWTSLFDKGGSSAIGAIAIAPSNPDVIYIG